MLTGYDGTTGGDDWKAYLDMPQPLGSVYARSIYASTASLRSPYTISRLEYWWKQAMGRVVPERDQVMSDERTDSANAKC